MPSLIHDGLERTYLLHTPLSGGVEGGPMPLVVMLHGSGGSGRHMTTLTRFDSFADSHGFVVCYPDAYQRSWNDGRGLDNVPSQAENVDDLGFLTALIDDVAAQVPIDRNRVYISGASNGGMMALYYACHNPARVAAIAPVMATVAERWAYSLKPAQPVPLLLIHGTDDPILPYNGGFVTFQGQTFGKAVALKQTAKLWAAHNGCASVPTISDLVGPDADMRVHSITYDACKDGAVVTAITIEGGGHTWPGGPQYLAEWLIGKTCRSFDAGAYIVDFFLRHRR